MFLKKMQTHFDSYHAILIKKKSGKNNQQLLLSLFYLHWMERDLKFFFNLRNI